MAFSYACVSLPISICTQPLLKRSQTTLFSSWRAYGPNYGIISAKKSLPFSLRIMSMASDLSSEAVVPRSVPVRVAHELLQAGHRYLDVRTVDEFNAGRPVGAINIPYMFKVGSGMSKNPNFLEEVSSVFGKDDEIIVGCQSGKRSLMAATELSSAGFTGVTDIAGGYSAWVQNGLPMEQ
ncbi:thiosulfate sulfurtransferase 16, chloroplastic-like isoform X1 [Ananas comosus]|uniref:Thiosulfate sulfurtransferase 16, chloroplastic-like isoform X1 n=1 Tax=Ananas comosus TaxID=4615 RepID=A0A6P5EDA6_ANACO|nr:thiosulfate sulfurtransferase 16, chloroplastic-like isoform X1 [Ananas comosus]